MSRAAHRRALPALDRHRNLPHAGHARPAPGAMSVGPRAPHRGPAGGDHHRDERPDTRNEQVLLAELTELAAELEADAAASLYRFGASRAYYGIVQERLDALDEESFPASTPGRGFLQRRLAPAMRTCRSIEERQANLSRKLTRATRCCAPGSMSRSRTEPRAAGFDEQPRTTAAAAAADGRRPVGRGSLLLCRRPDRLSGQGNVSVFGKVEAKPEHVTAGSVPIAIVVVWWLVRWCGARRTDVAEVASRRERLRSVI